jgi:tetratricopeptide (TPR) repeat protein
MNNLRLVKLEEMEKGQPQEPFIKFAIAQEHVNAANDVLAKTYFDWLLTNKPAYLPVYYQAGKLYERINDFARSKEIYRKGIELAKSTGEAKTAGELNEALMLIEDE